MRAVIDTNVLVSGIINPYGPPGRIVDAILSEVITVLYDDRILGEYRDVLMRPIFGFEHTNIETILNFIEVAGEHVSAKDVDLVLPDPADLPFLEVAMAGGADALVSGNLKHFKPRRGKHSIDVCTPADFLRRIV